MYPYFLLYAIVAALSITGSITKNKNWAKPIFVLLAIFSGFRYNVGVDYENYIKIFNNEYGYASQELGFNVIIDSIKIIGGTHQLLFLIYAALTQFFVYKALSRFDKNIWISIMIYLCVSTFYLATFNGMRQYLAIAIVMWSLKFIIDKKLVEYLITILLAAFFCHQSVLIFLPFYFLLNIRYSILKKAILLFSTIILSTILVQFIELTHYQIYLDREVDYQFNNSVYIFSIITLVLIIFEGGMLKFSSNPKVFRLLLNLNLFCFITIVLSIIQDSGILRQMMLRINSYFLFIYIILIPYIVGLIKNSELRFIIYLWFNISIFLIYYNTIANNGTKYTLVPYATNFILF